MSRKTKQDKTLNEAQQLLEILESYLKEDHDGYDYLLKNPKRFNLSRLELMSLINFSPETKRLWRNFTGFYLETSKASLQTGLSELLEDARDSEIVNEKIAIYRLFNEYLKNSKVVLALDFENINETESDISSENITDALNAFNDYKEFVNGTKKP